MNFDPGDSQIHILLINLDSLSLYPFLVSLANQQMLTRNQNSWIQVKVAGWPNDSQVTLIWVYELASRTL